jgi:repressor LexA
VAVEEPRAALRRLAEARGLSLAALSAAIRRNPAYLQQWMTRGSPRVLGEGDRRVLSAMLGCSEEVLGGPPLPPPPFAVPRLDVAASAGPGAQVDAEAVIADVPVDPEVARALRLRPGAAGIVRVLGRSMEPTLNDGDQLLVDLTGRTPDARGGVYLIRVEGALMVKRVRRGSAGLEVSSDNLDAAPVPDGPVEVVGRGVWRMGAVA